MKQNKMGIKGKILTITMIVLCGCETKENGFAYVDLGLPSGNLWATCNVGAEHPYDIGDFFAWGETQPKERYGWDNYKYITPDSSIKKYVHYPKSPYYDTLRALEPCDDAATTNMGGRWVTPTITEILELRQECESHLTDNYKGSGIGGVIFTSKHNGKSIFLPLITRDPHIEPSKGIHYFYWSANFYDDIIGYGDDGEPCIRKRCDKATPLEYAFGDLYRFLGSPVRGIIRNTSINDLEALMRKGEPAFKVDPIEDSPAYKGIIWDVMEEVADSIKQNYSEKGRDWGSVVIDYYQKKVLKKYGIDWESPDKLNHIEYDD